MSCPCLLFIYLFIYYYYYYYYFLGLLRGVALSGFFLLYDPSKFPNHSYDVTTSYRTILITCHKIECYVVHNLNPYHAHVSPSWHGNIVVSHDLKTTKSGSNLIIFQGFRFKNENNLVFLIFSNMF